MTDSLPIVLIPGLLCSPRLYSEQPPELWRFGPQLIADHTRDDSVEAIAQGILMAAPRRFDLVGLSMGGYIAFEIMRSSPDRMARLALLDTSARGYTRAERPSSRPDHARSRQTLRGSARSVVPRVGASVSPARRDPAADRTTHGRGDGSGGVRPPADGDHDASRLAPGPGRNPQPDPGAGRRRGQRDTT